VIVCLKEEAHCEMELFFITVKVCSKHCGLMLVFNKKSICIRKSILLFILRALKLDKRMGQKK